MCIRDRVYRTTWTTPPSTVMGEVQDDFGLLITPDNIIGAMQMSRTFHRKHLPGEEVRLIASIE